MNKYRTQIGIMAFAVLALTVGCSGLNESNLTDAPPPTLYSEDIEILEEEDEGEADTESIRLEDECLIGTWNVDHDSFAKYLSDSMNISEEVTFNITDTKGELVLSFDGDEMGFQTQSEPLEVTVEIVAEDFVLGTSIVAINAFGQAEYYIYPIEMDPDFLSDILVSRSAEFDITGGGGFTLAMDEAISGTATVSLIPGSFAVTAINDEPVYNYIYNDPNNEGMNVGYANYVCDDTELHLLAFSAVSYSPVIFIRR